MMFNNTFCQRAAAQEGSHSVPNKNTTQNLYEIFFKKSQAGPRLAFTLTVRHKSDPTQVQKKSIFFLFFGKVRKDCIFLDLSGVTFVTHGESER